MLIQFNFKNYKSFRDEVSLDLSATKITEHEDHVVDIANDRLLKVAAIYGANASGKSNVYNAFNYMSYYVVESFKFGDEEESRRKKETDFQKVTPFLFDDNSRNEETTFEVFYVDNSENTGRIYQYGFSLKADEVVEEWLYSKAKTARKNMIQFVWTAEVENVLLHSRKASRDAGRGTPARCPAGSGETRFFPYIDRKRQQKRARCGRAFFRQSPSIMR